MIHFLRTWRNSAVLAGVTLLCTVPWVIIGR